MLKKIIQRLKPSFSFMSILIFTDIKKSHNINCNVCRLHTAETSRYNKVILWFTMVCFNLMLVFELPEVNMVSSIKHGCKQQKYSMLLRLPCDFTLMHLSYIANPSCIPRTQPGTTFGFVYSTHPTVENLLPLTIKPQRKRKWERRKAK